MSSNPTDAPPAPTEPIQLSSSYTINVPSALTSPPTTPATATHTYTIDTSSRGAWLQSLENVIGGARDQMNKDLSEWKEAMKPFEKVQGGKKNAEEQEEQEEEEEKEMSEGSKLGEKEVVH